MKKFLLVNPFGIGDVLFSLSSVQRIREAFPNAVLGFVGNERTEELLRLCPALDRIYVFNRDNLRASVKKSPLAFVGELKKITGSIASEKYDVLIDFSLGREFSFAAMLMGIRRRIGFDFKGRGLFLTYKRKLNSYENIPVAQTQIDLLWGAGILPDNRMPEVLLIDVPGSSSGGRDAEGLVLAIAPGGGRSWGKDAVYKQWDPEKFIQAANAFIRGNKTARVVILGDLPEKPLLQSIADSIPGAECAVMSGESFQKVCAVLKRSSLLLCNDGGLLHLANALGVKTISIFGPVDEKVYGPYGGAAQRRVLVQDVPCRPCYKNFHFPACPHSRRCLDLLGFEKVVEVMGEIAYK